MKQLLSISDGSRYYDYILVHGEGPLRILIPDHCPEAFGKTTTYNIKFHVFNAVEPICYAEHTFDYGDALAITPVRYEGQNYYQAVYLDHIKLKTNKYYISFQTYKDGTYNPDYVGCQSIMDLVEPKELKFRFVELDGPKMKFTTDEDPLPILNKGYTDGKSTVSLSAELAVVDDDNIYWQHIDPERSGVDWSFDMRTATKTTVRYKGEEREEKTEPTPWPFASHEQYSEQLRFVAFLHADISRDGEPILRFDFRATPIPISPFLFGRLLAKQSKITL